MNRDAIAQGVRAAAGAQLHQFDILGSFAGEESSNERKRPRLQHQAPESDEGESCESGGELDECESRGESCESGSEVASDDDADEIDLDAVLTGVSWSALYHGIAQWQSEPSRTKEDSVARLSILRQWSQWVDASQRQLTFPTPLHMSMTDDIRQQFRALFEKVGRQEHARLASFESFHTGSCEPLCESDTFE